MKLLLVQHGDALPKEKDPERPLSPRGRSEVERLAAFLGNSGLRLTRILHSGKLRAAQTAELLAARILPDARPEAATGLNPNDPTEQIATRAVRWNDDVALVGHLPHMAKLAARLLTDKEDTPTVAFVPGTAACLERVGADQWTLAWMIRPDLLMHHLR
ncbi:MAG: phosphohistidine phosphatase SixA [Phycisphaerales bacterium]|nr:MAG: phosphohistidine phosphatase SixA [Phycisphaerales bacterium]